MVFFFFQHGSNVAVVWHINRGSQCLGWMAIFWNYAPSSGNLRVDVLRRWGVVLIGSMARSGTSSSIWLGIIQA